MIPRIFTVNGQPFFPLGGQARNSSGYNHAESEAAFRAVKLIHGNTLEIPIYWEQIEPVEGQFNFASLEALLSSARRYDVRLVLLWFGTWKNGNMDYTPDWVKTSPERFWRVKSASGKEVWVLSSHCPATLEADARAFEALCRQLKAADPQQTVIALQIENEPGILGSDRDYGSEAQSIYERPVPAELIENMKNAAPSREYEIWQQAGGNESGSWPEIFGREAGEMMTAWSIAVFINHLAARGKAILNIPMYINVWLRENGWMVPGESYPSGGAVSKTLELYKWLTPQVDLIAPDIYIADDKGYTAQCALYNRPNNPLFVPESAPGSSNSWNMFRALAEYNAIGYAFFAVEHILAPDGSLRPDHQMLADSFRCAAAAIPLLLRYQGTGKIHPVVQDENLGAQPLALDGWLGMADFGQGHKDWRHFQKGAPPYPARGRGLVFQAGRNEFYVVGSDFRLLLRPKLLPEQMLDISVVRDNLLACLAHYVSVEEGHFDAHGQFVADRRRNGDEIDFGVWVTPEVGVVRVRMTD